MAHIIILGAKPRSLISFRGDLIQSLIHAGHRVTAMSVPAGPEIIQKLEKLGADYRSYPVNRRGQSPVQDLQTMFDLRKTFAGLKPDVVLAYTIKPIIWGGLALKGRKETDFFALITGLGFAFQGQSLARKIITTLVTKLYRASLGKAQAVIFHNPDNRDIFIKRRIVEVLKCHVVPGSGISADRFVPASFPYSDPVFLTIGRLLGEKGFREFAHAAKEVKAHYPQAKFQILGPEEPSSDGISIQEIKEWEVRGWIEYLGETSDVRPFLAACHVYVLASYHEGMPRTVLEAMAMGRPVVTTDAPGCRETVEPGKNGFLVPVKDVQALAERLIWFIQHPELMEEMGRESRRLAEDRFEVHMINRQMMEIMGVDRG